MEEKIIKKLLTEAENVRKNAYAPYSNFKVGAALIDENNNIYTGANVENISFGLTICAERSAIFNLISNGGKNIKAIAIIGDTQEPISPCGACRQVIAEFGDKDTLIIMANLNGDYKVVKLEEILPFTFSFW